MSRTAERALNGLFEEPLGGFSKERLTMDELLTAKEVAKMLRINLSTVYLWVAQGKLPFVELSQSPNRRCVRFRRGSIEQRIVEAERPTRVDASGRW